MKGWCRRPTPSLPPIALLSYLFRKLRNCLAWTLNFSVGKGVVDTPKKYISLTFVNIKKFCIILFFEFGSFSCTFGSVSYIIPKSSIFIEERSTVLEGPPEASPRPASHTAAALWMYCLRKKGRSALRPLLFEYGSYLIRPFFFDLKNTRNKSERLSMEGFWASYQKSLTACSYKYILVHFPIF